MLEYLLSADAGARQIIVNSDNYDYTGVERIAKTLSDYGAKSTTSSKDYTSGLTSEVVTYTADSFYKASSSTQEGTNTGSESSSTTQS
jgi:hypothetical protein